MIRLVVAAASAVGLILFVTAVTNRLIRSRATGLSVRMQIFLALALVVGAFALGLGVLVVDRVEARAKNLALAAAHDEASAVATILQSEMTRSGIDFVPLATGFQRSQSSHFTPSVAQMGLELLTPNQQLLFPKADASRAKEAGAVYVDALVRRDGRVVGIVRVVKPTIVVQEMLADFAPTVLMISLLLGAAAAVSAAWIGRTIAAPIESLSRFAEQVSHGKPAPTPARAAGREVARLVRSIDAMRRQLEGRPFVEAFAADLSHELKNPVAAIRASAEVLEEGALEEPAEAAKFVRRIREATGKIERLLADLLSLAKLESQGATDLERVRLLDLVKEASRSLGIESRLEFPSGDDPQVRGHRSWLLRAVSNLVENAAIHSAEQTPITIGLRTSAGQGVVRIESTGSVANHVQKNLFRRFVTTRGDKGGTGLGLAIVRAVAEAHSGQVELVLAGPPRVAFELSLPLA